MASRFNQSKDFFKKKDDLGKKNSKFTHKELSSMYQQTMLQIFSAYRILNFLELKVSFYELEFYKSILSQYALKKTSEHLLHEQETFLKFKHKKVIDGDKFFLVTKLLQSEEIFLLEKYKLKKAQINQSFIFFFRTLIENKKNLQQQKIKNSFLLGLTLKKNRRIQIPRLKKVH